MTGRGAVITTTVWLPYNTSLYAIVGQLGTCNGLNLACNSNSVMSGAGGGTFVLLANGSALLAAGGGCGFYASGVTNPASCDASLNSTSGNDGFTCDGHSNSPGGVAGGAGGGYCYQGAGLFANSTFSSVSGADVGNTPSLSPLYGGNGSYSGDGSTSDRNGGFGGGGLSGGGGGYSGGGGSLSISCWYGGGGGSFCAQGISNCVTNRYNSAAGYVTITLVA